MRSRSTKNIGAATVLEFRLECMKRGAIVSEPSGDNAPYDLIVDSNRGDAPFRVQVKTAWPKPGVEGVFVFNGTRKIPRNSASPGPSSTSVAYKPGENDCVVAKAGKAWFFFADPSRLTGTVEVRPDAPPDGCKWNIGKNRWSVVGLEESASSANVRTERATAGVIIVTIVGGERLEKFKYWWAKAVTGFDSANHCQSCLRGPVLRPAGLGVPMNTPTPFDVPAEAKCLYFCGGSFGGWAHNFHAALVYAPGEHVVIPMFGDQQFLADDARLLPISPLPDGFGGLDKIYTTCRNFQFGVQQFGYDPPSSVVNRRLG